mgnify:CR=1 FL=1|jgi:hypothetical protein
MLERTEIVSFRLSREERALLDKILEAYSIKGESLSECFRMLLLELECELPLDLRLKRVKRHVNG